MGADGHDGAPQACLSPNHSLAQSVPSLQSSLFALSLLNFLEGGKEEEASSECIIWMVQKVNPWIPFNPQGAVFYRNQLSLTLQPSLVVSSPIASFSIHLNALCSSILHVVSCHCSK